jgi:hypothetical protein
VSSGCGKARIDREPIRCNTGFGKETAPSYT